MNFMQSRILIQIYELYALLLWYVTLMLCVIYKLFMYMMNADNNV